ncbi:MAG: redox-regulated ATPase YchF [Cytophagales bacterium]
MDNIAKNLSAHSFRVGLVGFPNVGKSTLFSTLCQRKVLCENFPFSTIEPNVGVVPMADDRLFQLSKLAASAVTIPTTVNVVDIAGIVKGASEGEGLGNKFLSHIRQTDAIAQVTRCFDNDQITHVAGGVDPVFDKEIINHELRAADIALLEKRIAKMAKKVRTRDKETLAEHELLQQVLAALKKGEDARDLALTDEAHRIAQRWQLLTLKPIIYVANVDDATLQGEENRHLKALQKSLAGQDKTIIPICIKLEAEIAALPLEERASFLSIYGLSDSSLKPLIEAFYQLLGLMTYFTAGPQETRAWTIPQNTRAPQAAGVIHSDLERDFIRAEVIKLTDYLTYKTEDGVKKAGKMSIEGKNYVVQDGDIIHFRCRS